MGLIHVYLLLFAVLLVEGIGIPGIPFEAVFLAAGYFIEGGEMPFILAVVVGTAGNLAGNIVGYWFGAKTVPMLIRKTRNNKLSTRGQELALSSFEKYGPAVVVISRWFGIIRTPTIVCAATMGMRPLPYILYSAIGAFSWTLIWQYASWKGINVFIYWWHFLLRHSSWWLDTLVVGGVLAVIGAVCYFYYRCFKK